MDSVALDFDTDSPRSTRSRQELEKALEREMRIASALREVGHALGATLDLDELLELILEKLTELVEADRAALYLLDERSQELVSRVVTGGQIRSVRMKVGEGIAGSVARSGRAVRIEDAHADDRFQTEWDLLSGEQTRSILAAPLKNNVGRTIGVIQALNKRCGEPFTSEDEATLTALSTQAAVAIDNSRLLLSLIQKNKQLLETKVQLERRVRDLELLFELERATAHATSSEELAGAVLERLGFACDARGAVLLLGEPDSEDLIEYSLDLDDPKLRTRGLRVDEGLLGEAFRKNQPSSVEGASGIEGGEFAFVVESLLVEPLEGDSGPLGALGLCNKREGRPFSEEDRSLLRLVSANVSTAVRLFQTNQAREREERLTSIGRLLSQVIHDFKSPMTVISGYVQMMEESDDPAQRAQYSEEILRQFETLSSMQREVLSFARGESEVFLRRVYLDRFFADLASQLRHELDGRRIALRLEVEPKLVGRFDSERITRAMLNLARNAIEAMGGHDGELTLLAYRDASDVVLGVADTGPGIPEEIRARLFQSFVTANKEGGTGLGLAIVKRIVQQHGGSVTVETSAEGARFELRLPNALIPPPRKTTLEPPRRATDGVEGLGESGKSPSSSKNRAASPKARTKASTRPQKRRVVRE